MWSASFIWARPGISWDYFGSSSVPRGEDCWSCCWCGSWCRYWCWCEWVGILPFSWVANTSKMKSKNQKFYLFILVETFFNRMPRPVLFRICLWKTLFTIPSVCFCSFDVSPAASEPLLLLITPWPSSIPLQYVSLNNSPVSPNHATSSLASLHDFKKRLLWTSRSKWKLPRLALGNIFQLQSL